MRPPTHDDPNAIPRNGTEVPWLDLDDPSRSPGRAGEHPPRDDAASTTGDRPRRR